VKKILQNADWKNTPAGKRFLGIKEPKVEPKVKRPPKGPKSREEKLAANRKYRSVPHNRFKNTRSRAQHRGKTWTLSQEEYLSIILAPCIYCNSNLNDTAGGLDRINNDIGYHLDNVVPCCGRCNITRGDRFTFKQMVEIGKLIATFKPEEP
jgi:hypothetical protein